MMARVFQVELAFSFGAQCVLQECSSIIYYYSLALRAGMAPRFVGMFVPRPVTNAQKLHSLSVPNEITMAVFITSPWLPPAHGDLLE